MRALYVAARLVRRCLPRHVVRGLLDRRILTPAMETRLPSTSADRYEATLRDIGEGLRGRRLMILGYGGHFAVGVELLRRGADHVVLCDPFAPPNDRLNSRLVPEHGADLRQDGQQVVPRPEWITLLRQDVRRVAPGSLSAVEVVVSNSVLEHLDDVAGVTRALAALTTPGGVHLHFVDISDHFLPYPFEMLCYSEAAWRRWLNPPSNLNRCRVADYRRVFEACFAEADIQVYRRDLPRFRHVHDRIQPRFLTGDEDTDAATHIRVIARRPRGPGSMGLGESNRLGASNGGGRREP